ncbi:hypothetical protein D3C77_599450 [compost metagenome]
MLAAYMAAQCLGHRPQGAAQVIEYGVGLGETCGQYADVFDNGRIAGYRAFDHVGKHAGDVFVEDEVRYLGQRLGENLVGFLAHGEITVVRKRRAF